MPQRERKPGISQTVVDLECQLAELKNAVAEKTEIADRFSQKLKDRDVTVRELGVVIDSERQNVRLVREELRKANAQIRELERQHAQESESVDCRYQHTSEELKIVSKLLDGLNEVNQDHSHDYGLEGSLDVFWGDTISGRVVYDSIYEGGVYLPTATLPWVTRRGDKPEKTSEALRQAEKAEGTS